MRLLNRAQSIYSDEYFISEDIKFELGMMYLRVNNVWRECDETTRSIHFDNMLDSEKNKIFVSLNENGKGGDKLEIIGNFERCFTPNSEAIAMLSRYNKSEMVFYVEGWKEFNLSNWLYYNNKYMNPKTYSDKIRINGNIKVIGIQK